MPVIIQINLETFENSEACLKNLLDENKLVIIVLISSTIEFFKNIKEIKDEGIFGSFSFKLGKTDFLFFVKLNLYNNPYLIP